MADFEIVSIEGATGKQWRDPQVGDLPSRLNAKATRPEMRTVAPYGSEIIVTLSASNSNPYVAYLVRQPAGPPVFPTVDDNVVKLVGLKAGHYHLRIRREDGGLWHLLFDVEEPDA